MYNFTVTEAIKFVNENDVNFIRLVFCDVFGMQKNITIMSSELQKAFDRGIPFDASSIRGFRSVEESDLYLVPDPSTLSILPWRPSQGGLISFFCDIKTPEGQAFEGDGRHILRQAEKFALEKGYKIRIGTECEFYLFELNDKGIPTDIPHDNCSYCDVAPLDRGENVRRDMCVALQGMGITPEMSHHGKGAGQHKVDFRYNDPLQAADNFITLKSVVKNIANRSGLHASFMPKPILGSNGNGLHLNLSITKDDQNIFEVSQENLKSVSANFVAGILNRIEEIMIFTNPLTNSYSRLGEFSAPKYITWSLGNRSQLIRIPSIGGAFKKMELRNADPSCSPYLAFALLIYAGLEGIENEFELQLPTKVNLFEAGIQTKGLKRLPLNLYESISKTSQSKFVNSVLGNDTLKRYLKEKKDEWQKFLKVTDKQTFEMMRYFNYY